MLKGRTAVIQLIFALLISALAVYSIVQSNRAGRESTQKQQAQATASVANGQAQDGKALASQVTKVCADATKAAELGNLCAKASTVAAAPSVSVPTATNGQNGSSGSPGRDGVNGSPGPTGPAGRPGTDGVNGKGAPGSPGSNGANGANGTVGPVGPPGVDGKDGKDGTPGTSGTDGSPGTSGTSGTSGADGTSGTSGTDGAPPASWSWTGTDGVNYTCTRAPDSPATAPTYTCLPTPAN